MTVPSCVPAISSALPYSRLCTALFLSCFQLPGVYKPPELSEIIQSSTTCSCLDNISPRLTSTSPLPASCSWMPMPRWEETAPVVCLASLADLLITSQTCPAVTVPSKRHQNWSPVKLALLSPCPPRGTIADHKSNLPSPGLHRLHFWLLQLSYDTSWYCHQLYLTLCSYFAIL